MLYNLYFSPTGGTKKVADCISKSIGEDCVSIDFIKYPDKKILFDGSDLCIISSPSYGGRVPEVFADMLSKINGNGAKCVIIGVFGNRAVDDTLIELKDIAEKIGFSVIAAVEAVAEHSLARVYASGRPDDYDVKELINFGKKIKNKFLKRTESVLNIPGSRPYKQFSPRPMELVLSDNCINCKKCAEECPVEAISTDNVSVYDRKKCFSCLHCVFVCPVNARQNSPEITKMFEERLRDRCAERKENKLYI